MFVYAIQVYKISLLPVQVSNEDPQIKINDTKAVSHTIEDKGKLIDVKLC